MMEFVLTLFTALCFVLVNLRYTRGDLISVSGWPKPNQRFSRCAHGEHNFEMRDLKDEDNDSDLLKYQTTESFTTFGTIQASRNPDNKAMELTPKNRNNVLSRNIQTKRVKLVPIVKEDRIGSTNNRQSARNFSVPSGLPFKLQNSTTNTIPNLEDKFEVTSQSPLNRPEGNRPPFSGQTGGNFYPQLIPPGSPWPSKEEDYSNSSQTPVSIADRNEVSSETPNNGNRPPFSGQTGGNFYPQLIPPGSPWPSKEEDYSNPSQTPVSIADRNEASSEAPNNGNRPPFSGQTGENFYPQLIPPGSPWPSKEEDYSNSSQTPVSIADRNEVSSETPNNGNRPPFSGQTGGNFYPQLIPPGRPWPSQSENYTDTTKIPVVEDRIEGSTENSFNRPEGNRPPFSGQTGGNFYPQLIPPGSPSPSQSENYTDTTKIPVVEDRIEGSTENSFNRPEGNRPPFSGQTGGNFYPQLIPPGSPSPSQSENYTDTTKIPVVEDRIEGSTENSFNRPEGNRPPFSGQTGGNFYPQLIPSGTPWPSKLEDYTSSTKIPVVEDRIELSSETSSSSNRPPFSGQTGGNFYPQLIPPGTPWPSKSEDYTSSTNNPALEDRIEAIMENSSNIPTGSRPPFVPSKFENHLTSTGKPLLEDITEDSKPDFPGHNKGNHSQSIHVNTLSTLVDRPEAISETPHNRPLRNRPPFSGQSGGHFYPQLIPAGTPWPSRAENFTPAPNIGLQDRIEANSEASMDRLTSNRVVVGETTSKNGIGTTTVSKRYPPFLDGIGLSGNFKPVVESYDVFVPQIVDPDMLILDLPSN